MGKRKLKSSGPAGNGPLSLNLSLGLLICAGLNLSCSKGGFSGSPGTAPTKKSASGGEAAAAAGKVDAKGESVSRTATTFPSAEKPAISFQGETPFQSVAADSEAWVVTNTTITRIKLDAAAGWPKTTWQMVDKAGNVATNDGNRTYVSELGLLVGRTNRGSANTRGVWLAKRDQPGQAKQIFEPTDMGNGSRLSVTSFKIGAQPYIGFAYGTSGGNKKFVRIPLDKSKPDGIDLARKEERELSALNAGSGGFSAVGNFAAYGSFMDQSRKAFYLGATGGGGWGVNVETMAELPLTSIPNWRIGGDPLNPAAAAARKICNFTMSTGSSLGYALAGDLKGNVVSAAGSYTFAHDPVNNVIFGNRQGGGDLTVAKQECVESAGADCTEAAKTCQRLPTAQGGAIGPMSAVGDGRVVGIQRGSTSQVFLLAVIDKNDLSKGISITKIADIPGNAYMYNDFTGITLYSPDQVKVIDFKSLKGFDPKKGVRKVAAGWTAQSKQIEDLRGLKLELTCFKTGKPKPPYVDYSAQLKSSVSLFTVAEKDCSGDVDAMEVKMSSDGTTNNFTRLSTFEIRGAQ